MTRCHHVWSAPQVTYTPPPGTVKNASGRREDVLALAFGLTVFTQQCINCLQVRTETAPGRATAPLDQS